MKPFTWDWFVIRACRVALVFAGIVLEVSAQKHDGLGMAVAFIQIAAVWVFLNEKERKS